MASNLAAHGVNADDHSHDHPSDRKYIEIAAILTVITLAEVAIYYVDWMHDSGALVPTLLIMSLAKFVTVIGYYMHLKFDDPLFRNIFIAGLLVSLAVVGAVAALIVTHRIEVATSYLA